MGRKQKEDVKVNEDANVKVVKYKLLAGVHYDEQNTKFEKNAIIETEIDLVKKHGRKKFQLVK